MPLRGGSPADFGSAGTAASARSSGRPTGRASPIRLRSTRRVSSSVAYRPWCLAARARAGHDDSPTARRITRTDWRFDGIGHLDRWSHLSSSRPAVGRAPRQVTSGDWGVAEITWHPGGETVAFTTDRGPEPDLRPRTTVWASMWTRRARSAREILAPPGWANRPGVLARRPLARRRSGSPSQTRSTMSARGCCSGRQTRAARRWTWHPTLTGPSELGGHGPHTAGWSTAAMGRPGSAGADRRGRLGPGPVRTHAAFTDRSRDRSIARRRATRGGRIDDALPGRLVGRPVVVARHRRRPGDGADDRRCRPGR